MFNRQTFFDSIRRAPFEGKITKKQVEGFEKILDYFISSGYDKDLRKFAYVLATIALETGMRFQPLLEQGSEKYLRSKKYYPYIGTGLVQITWKANYDKYGLKTPADGLVWDKALYIIFDGMYNGEFTGKKLGHYFTIMITDPVGARRIINGQDQARKIAGYWKDFFTALVRAQTDFMDSQKIIVSVEKTKEVTIKDNKITEIKEITTKEVEEVPKVAPPPTEEEEPGDNDEEDDKGASG